MTLDVEPVVLGPADRALVEATRRREPDKTIFRDRDRLRTWICETSVVLKLLEEGWSEARAALC